MSIQNIHRPHFKERQTVLQHSHGRIVETVEEWQALRTTNIIERLNKEFKRRTKSMEIVAGENACYRLLAFISLKMEMHWYHLPIFQRVPLAEFTQNA